jgi:hypothetical protein
MSDGTPRQGLDWTAHLDDERSVGMYPQGWVLMTAAACVCELFPYMCDPVFRH